MTRRSLTAAALLAAVAVVVTSIVSSTTNWVGGAGFIASIGVALLMVGIARCSTRVVATAAGLLGAGAALAGLGRPASPAACLEAALLGSLTLLAAELGWWSIEMRSAVPVGGLDTSRLMTILATAFGGAAFGGTAVGLVYGHARTGNLLVVLAGAVATCLVLALAIMVAPVAARRAGSSEA